MTIQIPASGSAATRALPDALEPGTLCVDGKGYGGDLRATGRAQHFARDREIYGDGADADYVFKVEAGVVRTYKVLRDGRRQVNAFHVPGHVFGLEAGATYSLSAAAASDCTVVAYRRRHLEELAANNDKLSIQLFSSALRSLARAQEHSLSLGRRTAVEKVAMFLIGCIEYSTGSDEIDLVMKRKDIADYLGLTIETVSRTFADLEHRAFIELTGVRQVRLRDTAALRELCA